MGSERTYSRKLEEIDEGNVSTELLLQTCMYLCNDQRMSTEIEEIGIDVEPIHTKRIAPNL